MLSKIEHLLSLKTVVMAPVALHSCSTADCADASQVTRQVFEAGQGRLKVVGRAGVGIDNVDLQAATEVRHV